MYVTWRTHTDLDAIEEYVFSCLLLLFWHNVCFENILINYKLQLYISYKDI